MTKSQYNAFLPDIDKFIHEHARRLRQMVDLVGSHTQHEIDDAIIAARTHTNPKEVRAESAFNAYAWIRAIKPFAHEKRHFHQNMDALVDVIKLHPDWYYRYALFFTDIPDLECYETLKLSHPPTARLYFGYCIAARVAELIGQPLGPLANWSATSDVVPIPPIGV